MCYNIFIGTNITDVSISKISVLAVDLAKNEFQLCGNWLVIVHTLHKLMETFRVGP